MLLGLLLLAGAAYLGYQVYQRRMQPTVQAPSVYTYTVTQAVASEVSYFQNSFYADGPGTNTAYVTDLTNTIDTLFQYTFSASEPQELTYRYQVKATVRGKYTFQGDEAGGSNVWAREFELIKPVSGTKTTDRLVLEPRVEVPYAEYKELLDQLKTTLVLPVDGEIVIALTMQVSGEVDGVPLDDTRTATMTVPVGPQIYEIATTYDKKDTKQIVPAATREGIDRWAQYELYGAAALGVLALAAFVYGFRRKIFKTPYQRELDRIYRYHDGIIVRTSRQPDLAHKSVVQVRSFEDLLNIEEETKSPIVSVSTGGETTKFMIIQGDVVYVYVLGKVVPGELKTLEEIQAHLPPKAAARKPPVHKQKIQG